MGGGRLAAVEEVSTEYVESKVFGRIEKKKKSITVRISAHLFMRKKTPPQKKFHPLPRFARAECAPTRWQGSTAKTRIAVRDCSRRPLLQLFY